MHQTVDSQDILLAEFSSLRSEITTFITLQVQILGFSVVLWGALMTIGFSHWVDFRDFLAVCPIPFLLLALLYADAKARIIRAASYIQVKLSPNLHDLSWEVFIRTEYRLRWFVSATEWMRWLFFLFPALSSFLLSCWKPPNNAGTLAFYPFLLFLDLILIGLLIWSVFTLTQHEK